MRAAACESLVREHGQPSHATERVAKWALWMPNGTGHYTVELTPEYTDVQLTVTFRMKRFW